jgi:hypothetical protein
LTPDDYEDDSDDTGDQPLHYAISSRSHHGEKHFNNDFPLRDDATSLRNVVESKDREIQQISARLELEKKQHKAVVDEFEKRLTIAESEKERVRVFVTKDMTTFMLYFAF